MWARRQYYPGSARPVKENIIICISSAICGIEFCALRIPAEQIFPSRSHIFLIGSILLLLWHKWNINIY